MDLFNSNQNHIRPFTVLEEKEKGKGFYYKDNEFIHHSDLSHEEMAIQSFSRPQIIWIFSFLAFLCLCLAWNWHMTLTTIIAMLTILYFADILFNFFLISRSFNKTLNIQVSEAEIRKRQHRFWPKYTVMCPLYKEWQVVPQFVEAINEIDYPKEKLQVILLLEEDDRETINKIAEFTLPAYFDVVVVPHSMPKTKPKALNYGLRLAKGKYVVVYDAEDVPNPDQLKKAVIAFEKSHGKIICIQAKLNFYNPKQNILTRIFSAEYALWFDLVLPGMQSINGPIPLGGTSNHFRREDLIALKGWDAFNVTEDCDLGIRLAKRGYRTAIIDSTTMEEANSQFKNWYSQRSRWIKGYIQTYLVHMRNPQEFRREKWQDLLWFQFIVAGKISSIIINPFMWAVTVVYFLFRATAGPVIESFFPPLVLFLGVFSLVFGNFLYLYYYMIGCAKRGYYDLIKYVYLVPLYWLFMSFAAWRAIYEIFVRPHYWAKTKHGLHLTEDKPIFTRPLGLVREEEE